MLGSLISAGASLLGGAMSSSANAEQAEANRAFQREAMQSGIQWKVADAKKAGIHPIYALGAPTFSPGSSVVGDTMGPAVASAGREIARGLEGQDVTRARMATETASGRDAAFNNTVNEMTLQRMTLQNDLLASQIQRLKAMSNPAFPDSGSYSLPQDKAPNRTPIVVGGKIIRTEPGTSDTQDITNRYGEGIGDWVYGPYTLWRDYVNHTFGKQPSAMEAKRARPVGR